MGSADDAPYMPSLLCLVLGTRGDVQPLALLAASLAEKGDHLVTLVTHAAHKPWLQIPLEHAGVATSWIDAPPAGRWDQSQGGAAAGEKRKHVASVGPEAVPAGLGPYREELVRSVEAVIGTTLPLTDGDTCPSGTKQPLLPVAVVSNLLCLEGYHIAEAIGCSLIMASPYQVPYGCPSSFERRFSSAFPDLFEALTADPVADQCNEGSAAAGSLLPEHTKEVAAQMLPRRIQQQVSWTDLEHWMWPLFTERWGGWRSRRLGLPPIPLTSPDGDPLSPLPRPPLLLYGFSELVVPRPGYWPKHFVSCGFWVPHNAWHEDGPAHAGSGLSIPADRLVSKTMQMASDSAQDKMVQQVPDDDPGTGKEGTPAGSEAPILIDFGGMGSMGLLGDPEHLVSALLEALGDLGRSGILLSGGWQPLEAACCKAAEESNGSVSGNSAMGSSENPRAAPRVELCCLKACPHGSLMPGCAAVLHHGGSGTTAAALMAGLPQVICPLQFDQYFWAEKMAWLGLAPEPLSRDLIFREHQHSGDEDPGFQQQQRDLSRGGCAPSQSSSGALADVPSPSASVLLEALRQALTPRAREAAKESQRMLLAEAQQNGGTAVSFASQCIAQYLRETHAPMIPSSSTSGHKQGQQKPERCHRGGTEQLQAAGLPEGFKFRCFGLEEALSIQKEVLLDCVYLRNGIRVGPGDVVVDVGANIGLFCLLMVAGPQKQPDAERQGKAPGLPEGQGGRDQSHHPLGLDGGISSWAGPPAAVFALEPVPPVFEALKHNVEQLEACGLARPGQVKLLKLGLGKCVDNGADFTFYPGMAGNSTQHPREKACQYARMRPAVRDACFASPVAYSAPLETVSTIMQQNGIRRIDLLKVDVEGSEEAVLAGVCDDDWPKIRQVVVEVHDEADDASRVARVEALILEKGFVEVIVDRASNEDAGGRQFHHVNAGEAAPGDECQDLSASPAAGAVVVPGTAMVYAWRNHH